MKMRTEYWEGHEIRFVFKDDEWWALATDVCAALDIKNPSLAVNGRQRTDENGNTYWSGGLDDEEKGIVSVNTPGGIQDLLVVSEVGIYELTFRSRKKEAKEFKKWVKQLLKAVRAQSGLEGFQVFRMMDKEHQKKISAEIHGNVPNPSKFDHIKVNTVANKVVSSLFGFDKSMKKHEMPPEMLKVRQPILEEAKDLHILKEKYDLDFSVSETLKKRWLSSQTH